ncbi:hypothetical protein, partial [Segatella sp.]|uniref:hypothetical protein n=1 Tax=Segatella sp. TaxID=2974253 RepID=UPI00307ADAF3
NLFDLDYVGIKASQFSFKADPVLGVDMISFVLNCYFGTKAIKNNEKWGVLVNFNTDNLDYNGSYESDLAKLT